MMGLGLWSLLLGFAASFQGDCVLLGRGDELGDIPGLGAEAILYEASARVTLTLDPARVGDQSDAQVYRALMSDIEALVRNYPNFRTITPLVRLAYGHRADHAQPMSAIAFVRELGLRCSPGLQPGSDGACPQNNYLLPQRRLRELLANMADNYAVTWGQLKACRGDVRAWLRAIAGAAGTPAAALTSDQDLASALLNGDGGPLRDALRAVTPRGCTPDRGYDYLYLSYAVGPGTEPSWYLISYDFSAGGPQGEIPARTTRIVPFEALAGPSRYLKGAYTATYRPATGASKATLELDGRYRVDLALWPESIATQYHKQFITDFVRTVSQHITYAEE